MFYKILLNFFFSLLSLIMKENKDDQLLSLKLTEKIEVSYYKDTFHTKTKCQN